MLPIIVYSNKILVYIPHLKAGSQYDAGAASVVSDTSVAGESIFWTSPILFLKSNFDILIGWMLANAGNAMLELNLSQLQHHPNTRDAILVLAS